MLILMLYTCNLKRHYCTFGKLCYKSFEVYLKLFLLLLFSSCLVVICGHEIDILSGKFCVFLHFSKENNVESKPLKQIMNTKVIHISASTETPLLNCI